MTRLWSALASQRKRLSEFGSALLFELVDAASVILTFPLITRGLGPEQYGIYTTLYVIVGLAATWGFGATSAAVLQLVVQRHRSIPSTRRWAVRQVYLVTGPFVACALGFSVWLFGSSVLPAALLFVGVNVLLSAISEIRMSLVFAVRGASVVARARLTAPIIRVIGVATLWFTGHVTVFNIAVIHLVMVVAILVISGYLMRDVESHDEQRERSASSAGEVARLSAVYAATISANAAQDQGEKLILAAYRPPTEVGEYQAAYRVVFAVLLPLRAVVPIGYRWFFTPSERRRGQVTRALRLSLPIALYGLFAVAAILLSRNLIEAVLGDDYAIAAEITTWLCAVPLLRGLAEVPSMGLLGLGRNGLKAVCGISNAGLALLLYFVLVPSYGWRGAVIGTYVSELTSLISMWVLLLIYQAQADREGAFIDRETAGRDQRGDLGHGPVDVEG